MHSIYTRTVTSKRLLSALLNWFMCPFGQSNVHASYARLLLRPDRKESNLPTLAKSTVLIYILCGSGCDKRPSKSGN
jgi:hypothetical protein